MTNYSNVYLGFTGAVETFGTDQIVGRQSIHMNRIVLETDTPYMRPGGGGINTPAFIGDVASIVASKLRIPVRHLLKSIVQYSRQLYGCSIILPIYNVSICRILVSMFSDRIRVDY